MLCKASAAVASVEMSLQRLLAAPHLQPLLAAPYLQSMLVLSGVLLLFFWCRVNLLPISPQLDTPMHKLCSRCLHAQYGAYPV